MISVLPDLCMFLLGVFLAPSESKNEGSPFSRGMWPLKPILLSWKFAPLVRFCMK